MTVVKYAREREKVVCRSVLYAAIYMNTRDATRRNVTRQTFQHAAEISPQRQKEWVINYGGGKRRRQATLNYTILLGVIIFSSDDITWRRMFIARQDQNTLEVNRTLKVKKNVFNFILHFNVKYDPATSKLAVKRQIHTSIEALYCFISSILSTRQRARGKDFSPRDYCSVIIKTLLLKFYL